MYTTFYVKEIFAWVIGRQDIQGYDLLCDRLFLSPFSSSYMVDRSNWSFKMCGFHFFTSKNFCVGCEGRQDIQGYSLLRDRLFLSPFSSFLSTGIIDRVKGLGFYNLVNHVDGRMAFFTTKKIIATDKNATFHSIFCTPSIPLLSIQLKKAPRIR